MKIENAKITSVGWNRERGLTHWIGIDGDGWVCCFGGYHLGGECCYKWIIKLMDTLELDNFDDKTLIGQVCRVQTDGWGGEIIAIGHPIKDKWFNPKSYLLKEILNEYNIIKCSAKMG